MSESDRNIENLRKIRDKLVGQRQEVASNAAEAGGISEIDKLIEIQCRIEVLDRAINDEVKRFTPDLWSELASL